MLEMALGILLDPLYKRHDTGPRHPETPDRYDAVTRALSGVKAEPVKPREASIDELALCHTREYLATARTAISRGARELPTGDTQVSAASWDVAVQAVGGVLNAVDAVIQGRIQRAFCAVRPPGHHATPVRGMGFCVFNNIAVGALYARKKHGVQRVLIVDWDVHHGNGTQDAFYQDGSVLFVSTHQHPWYPGTGMAEERGEGKGSGRILNYPLPEGTGRELIVNQIFRQDLVKAADAFKPDLVMISAGFDSREGDPLGRFRLTDDDFREMTWVLRDVAEKHAGGRLVSVLEGGYSLPGLAAGVSAHVNALK
jgi:acetoin utilization deacetylase AcuC-like enzyme